MLWLKLAMKCEKKKINDAFYSCMNLYVCMCVCVTHLSQSFGLLQELVQQPADIKAAKESTETIINPSQKFKLSVCVWLVIH